MKRMKVTAIILLIMIITPLMTSCFLFGPADLPEPPEIEETVLYDAKGLSIVAKDITIGMTGYEIPITISNSGIKQVSFQTIFLMVNGIDIDTLHSGINTNVGAGETVEEVIVLEEVDLEACGISEIADISLVLDLTFWGTITEDRERTGVISIPTSNSDYEQEIDLDGTVIYNENGIEIIYKGIGEDAWGSDAFIFLVHNTSDKVIRVSSDEIIINGYLVDSDFYSYIYPSIYGYTAVKFQLDEADVESVDDIENFEISFILENAETKREIATTDLIFVETEESDS